MRLMTFFSFTTHFWLSEPSICDLSKDFSAKSVREGTCLTSFDSKPQRPSQKVMKEYEKQVKIGAKRSKSARNRRKNH